MTRGSVLLVGQAGGPTPVINASLVGIVRTAQAYPQISAILGTRFGILGVLTEDLVDLGREDTTALEQVGHTPSAALGTSRRRLKDDDAERVVAVLRAHGVRYILLVHRWQ